MTENGRHKNELAFPQPRQLMPVGWSQFPCMGLVCCDMLPSSSFSSNVQEWSYTLRQWSKWAYGHQCIFAAVVMKQTKKNSFRSPLLGLIVAWLSLVHFQNGCSLTCYPLTSFSSNLQGDTPTKQTNIRPPRLCLGGNIIRQQALMTNILNLWDLVGTLDCSWTCNSSSHKSTLSALSWTASLGSLLWCSLQALTLVQPT